MSQWRSSVAWITGWCFASALLAQNPEQDIRKAAGPGAQGPYVVEDGAIVAHNGERYHNRPLYCNHIPAFVLAGDRPHLRLGRDPYVYGSFMIAYVRQGKAVWLHEASQRKSLYRPGHMEWRVFDPLFSRTEVVIDAVPLAENAGAAIRLSAKDAQAGDQLIFAFGGATKRPDSPFPNISWALDPRGNAGLPKRGFVPEDCAGNTVRLEGDLFTITPPAYEPAAKVPVHTVAGRCSEAAQWVIGDAALWQDLLKLARSAESKRPIACGAIKLQARENEIYWAVEAFESAQVGDRSRLNNPRQAFEAGLQRVQAIGKQVVVDTPEPRLNAAVAATCHAIDGVFYPPIYVHGGMLWNMPFPGWRTLYGPTALGWHDNVKEQAKFYIANQETDDSRRLPHAEPSVGYGQEAGDSRFYGKGRIKPHNGFYNFQSQFFDMLVHAWRWTGDEELEKLLRPALEMHLEWQRECFDPDGDGLYESYINTWPTDSVWYAGGAGAEETAYAYTGHQAAAELAQRAGDMIARDKHRQQADKIQKAFVDRFWIKDKGYPGLYIEQTGLKRLHEDSWLYSIFLPIDAGLLSPRQKVEALHYTEWGLQRDKMPLGGERCWTSNWVPSVWSTRVMYPGDNYHLALAYFQAGLPEQGWEILKGTFLEAAYNGPVPGCPAISIGGTDFTDCTSMFARAVVEGLFGYKPGYEVRRQDGREAIERVVHCSPRFPADWDHASIRTPDFSLVFRRQWNAETYELSLAKPARVVFDALAHEGDDINAGLMAKNLRLKETRMLPGYGATVVQMGTYDEVQSATLTIEAERRLSRAITELVCRPGERISLRGEKRSLHSLLGGAGGDVHSFEDPQGVLKDAHIQDGVLYGTVESTIGHHRLFAEIGDQDLSHWQIFNVHVKESEGTVGTAEPASVPAGTRWEPVDMQSAFNGDIRTIYKQQYLAPRPKTCSVRIGSDGYSPWTFYYWNLKPPEIDLANVPGMLKDGRIITKQGVPFAWAATPDTGPASVPAANSRNIAFTSQWDNWPRSVNVPVGKQGDAAWFLVCGTTNPMQTRIANGVIRLVYADGSVDALELVPPNNFWTLCPLRTSDYDYKVDAFCLPKEPPATVQLGNNCRAMLLNRRLKQGITLDRVELETLSPEVVIGLMGVTIMNEQ